MTSRPAAMSSTTNADGIKATPSPSRAASRAKNMCSKRANRALAGRALPAFANQSVQPSAAGLGFDQLMSRKLIGGPRSDSLRPIPGHRLPAEPSTRMAPMASRHGAGPTGGWRCRPHSSSAREAVQCLSTAAHRCRGNAAESRESRGISHFIVNVGGALTLRVRGASPRLMPSIAAARRSKAGATPANRRWPASVSVRVAPRSNSLTPSVFSSDVI